MVVAVVVDTQSAAKAERAADLSAAQAAVQAELAVDTQAAVRAAQAAEAVPAERSPAVPAELARPRLS